MSNATVPTQASSSTTTHRALLDAVTTALLYAGSIGACVAVLATAADLLLGFSATSDIRMLGMATLWGTPVGYMMIAAGLTGASRTTGVTATCGALLMSVVAASGAFRLVRSLDMATLGNEFRPLTTVLLVDSGFVTLGWSCVAAWGVVTIPGKLRYALPVCALVGVLSQVGSGLYALYITGGFWYRTTAWLHVLGAVLLCAACAQLAVALWKLARDGSSANAERR